MLLQRETKSQKNNRYSKSLGYTDNVVVLTRNKGYRKEDKPSKVPPFFYRKYPELRHAIASRNMMYNQQIALVEELEDKGELIVLRPQKPIEVSRMERDTAKLLALYDEGYQTAAAYL